MAHECTGAFGHTREVVPPALGDDLVCFTCGSKIAPLLLFGDDGVDEAAGVSESLPDTATAAAAQTSTSTGGKAGGQSHT